MRIDRPETPTILYDDFDFTFSNGLLMSFSVAKELGDTVDWDTNPMAVKFHLAEKSSSTDAEAKVPPEDITVLMQHVISVSHRTRKVSLPTKEERDLFQQALHQIPKILQ